MDKAKIKDYITTGALGMIPIIVAYQAQIGAYIPVEYTLIFTIAMAALSQLAADKRVIKAKADVVDDVELINEAIDAKQAKLVELQAELDKYQALASKVVAPEEVADVME